LSRDKLILFLFFLLKHITPNVQ